MYVKELSNSSTDRSFIHVKRSFDASEVINYVMKESECTESKAKRQIFPLFLKIMKGIEWTSWKRMLLTSTLTMIRSCKLSTLVFYSRKGPMQYNTLFLFCLRFHTTLTKNQTLKSKLLNENVILKNGVSQRNIFVKQIGNVFTHFNTIIKSICK